MENRTEWLVPPPEIILHRDEIHVWRASLDKEANVVRDLAMNLSSDELLRAERFRFTRDREHFVVARGLLRRMLGAYLKVRPNEVRFQYGPQGKPSLRPNDLGSATLNFNLAHSHGQAVYAFAHGRELGVDTEQIRNEVRVEEIASRYFSARETEELLALPVSERIKGFFLAWTRKEAYIKARGEGLQIQLDSFDVTLNPDQPAAFSRGVDSRFHLIAFFVGEQYPGSLVYDGTPCTSLFFDCSCVAL
jgi:4'-phosphopantetheinyl transferase